MAYMSGLLLLIICKLSHQAAITLLSGDRSCSVAAAAAEVLQQSWQKSASIGGGTGNCEVEMGRTFTQYCHTWDTNCSHISPNTWILLMAHKQIRENPFICRAKVSEFIWFMVFKNQSVLSATLTWLDTVCPRPRLLCGSGTRWITGQQHPISSAFSNNYYYHSPQTWTGH